MALRPEPDALRLIRSRRTCAWSSASTTLSDGSDFDEQSLYWIAYVSNNDFGRHLGAYVLDREEQGGGDRSTYLARAPGEWFRAHDVWLDAAWLNGESAGVDVGAFDRSRHHGRRGTADRGSTRLRLRLRRRRERHVRQPALADNTDKLGGETSFQYYGELFD